MHPLGARAVSDRQIEHPGDDELVPNGGERMGFVVEAAVAALVQSLEELRKPS
jgi:hypothetical protein